MVKHKRLEFVDIPWILYENPSHFSHQAFIRDGMDRKQQSSILWSIVKYVLLALITISSVDLYKSGGYTGKRFVHPQKYSYNELVFLIFRSYISCCLDLKVPSFLKNCIQFYIQVILRDKKNNPIFNG